MLESCGALEVGEIWTTWSGIVTDCAIGIVALEAISPMITFTWFDLTSFVAASTDAVACDWPSSDATSRTLIFDERWSRFSDAFCSDTASLTARSRFAPYAARSPVNGSTSPIFSVNAHGFAALAPTGDAEDAIAAAVIDAVTRTVSNHRRLFMRPSFTESRRPGASRASEACSRARRTVGRLPACG